MDRTWRWRKLLPGVEARYFETPAEAWNETIRSDQAPRVYPQTVRLREDTTIHVKGTRRQAGGGVEVGRWYQRYLPAGNALVPSEGLRPNQRPETGYAHPWKFLPERTFRRADRFSHLGVYDTVDSRTRYYPVTPAGEAAAAALAAGEGKEWVDAGRQLGVEAWRFPWRGGLLGRHPRHPPSLHEPLMRLRIVRRGARGWIALHWDKRDDDLIPFDGLPQTVMLTNTAGSGVRVTLAPGVAIEAPPAVRRAHFWLEASGTTRRAGIAFTSPLLALAGREFERVWRVRMAALEPVPGDPSQIGRVVRLFDAETHGRFARDEGGHYVHRWVPRAEELAAFQRYCSPAGEADFATSLWFEDVVGHVGVPDELRWTPPPALRVTSTPANLPLGMPVQVTVQAEDIHTSASLAGTVKVDGQPVGRTGAPFTHVFNSRRVPSERDPETGEWLYQVVFPAGTVSIVNYPDATIPWQFYEYVSNAAFVRQSVPATMVTGQSYGVSVTMRNTGTSTWIPSGSNRFRLGSQNPQDNTVWGSSRRELPGEVLPGAEVTFEFTVTAPSPGTYYFQWRMLQELIAWFGAPSPAVAVNVTPISSLPRLTVSASPSTITIDRPTTVTISSKDASTGALVAGRVWIDGVDSAATNKAFTQTFFGSETLTVRAPGYAEAVVRVQFSFPTF
jgi:hypothetical protein